MIANSTQMPPLELAEPDSEAFQKQMKILQFLKEPEGQPVITKMNPKICLTCWVVYTDADARHHPSTQNHTSTGTFTTM